MVIKNVVVSSESHFSWKNSHKSISYAVMLSTSRYLLHKKAILISIYKSHNIWSQIHQKHVKKHVHTWNLLCYIRMQWWWSKKYDFTIYTTSSHSREEISHFSKVHDHKTVLTYGIFWYFLYPKKRNCLRNNTRIGKFFRSSFITIQGFL